MLCHLVVASLALRPTLPSAAATRALSQPLNSAARHAVSEDTARTTTILLAAEKADNGAAPQGGKVGLAIIAVAVGCTTVRGRNSFVVETSPADAQSVVSIRADTQMALVPLESLQPAFWPT